MSGNENSGRKKVIDLKDKSICRQIATFGSLLATQKEMADILGVCKKTIENYMSDENNDFYIIYHEAAAESKTSLRRVQMYKALAGDNTLLIWLGKQLLDQKDKVEEKIDTTQRIVVIDSDDAEL